ncbi:MAG: TM2 domain-containing protein [Muribaculaceae bacterium]|nr:TM2 domain-containing protein [Muribaculaceae bacterium]
MNPIQNPDPGYYHNDPFASGPYGKSRGLAALFAIFLGSFGIHYFYLGKTTAGILTILLWCVTCSVWGVLMFIQGIYMFCIDNAKFERIYVLSNSTLPLF